MSLFYWKFLCLEILKKQTSPKKNLNRSKYSIICWSQRFEKSIQPQELESRITTLNHEGQNIIQIQTDLKRQLMPGSNSSRNYFYFNWLHKEEERKWQLETLQNKHQHSNKKTAESTRKELELARVGIINWAGWRGFPLFLTYREIFNQKKKNPTLKDIFFTFELMNFKRRKATTQKEKERYYQRSVAEQQRYFKSGLSCVWNSVQRDTLPQNVTSGLSMYRFRFPMGFPGPWCDMNWGFGDGTLTTHSMLKK